MTMPSTAVTTVRASTLPIRYLLRGRIRGAASCSLLLRAGVGLSSWLSEHSTSSVPCVTVFGSARFGRGPSWTTASSCRVGTPACAYRLHGHDGRLARPDGSGQSRRPRGGRSFGWMQHHLPREQRPNAYLDRWVTCRDLLRSEGLLSSTTLTRIHRASRRRRHRSTSCSRPSRSYRPGRSATSPWS